MSPSPQKSQLVDINALVNASRLMAKPHESPRETQSRLAREEAEATHLRQKDLMVTRCVLVTVGVVSVVCIAVVLIPGMPVENSKWATTLLTMVVSGGLGHMTGKSSK